MKQVDFRALRRIFFLQIGLVILLGLLFYIGLADNGMELGSFFFVLVLGALGASVSLMKRILDNRPLFKSDIPSFKILETLIPILYGTLMSGIAYLLFMSGILSGDGGGGLFTTNLFPNFVELGEKSDNLLEQFQAMYPAGMQNTGKLLVWAFLAGYSERFVSRILGQLENRAAPEKGK